MDFLVKDAALEIRYTPGNGAWTYQLIIPNTRDLKGKWGDLKVSGIIDGHRIESKNLFPSKNADKKLAINSEIRNSINKGAGDMVTVTLFLENQSQELGNGEIFECFKDAEVLPIFETLANDEQQKILSDIKGVATEDQKAEKIIEAIASLNGKR